MPIHARPTLAEDIAALIADGDRHATDGVLPVRAVYFIIPTGKLVRTNGKAIR